LTLIGWLARRMPGEEAHQAGIAEMMPSALRARTNRRMR
jgi:hypothetical protein